uniref:AIG1-type G domain-containing protein n=1 Tax=Takifugu rubripes TaxID=31033 RepID=A0A3B5K9D3_TAKRU
LHMRNSRNAKGNDSHPRLNSGKSSLGNVILGKEEFATGERTSCSRRVGVVCGRWLTVVDTPGWWCDFSSEDTSGLVKREIRSSVSLCPPGPHAFLVVVKASSGFPERRRRAVEEHVALLGEGVWDHCVVVFTSEVSSAQTREEGEQTGLRWLAEKCGHRCHAVGSGGDGEVAQLLEKILQLVRENGNRAFETGRQVLRAMAAESGRAEEEAQRRFLRVKKQRSLARGEQNPRRFLSVAFVVPLRFDRARSALGVKLQLQVRAESDTSARAVE